MLMSLLTATLLASTQAEAAPEQAAPAPEIVVIGQRLKRIRIAAKHDRKTGRYRCVVKRSSGDPRLDAGFCDAAVACAAVERTQAGMNACMEPRIARLAADLAAAPAPNPR